MGIFWIFISTVLIGTTKLPTFLAEFALPFHHACVSRVPESEHHALHAALVCGAKLPSGEAAETFLKTGLLHLIVVSGAHLIWLESLLRRLLGHGQTANGLIVSILIVFALATRLEAPVVRAAISMGLYALSRRRRLGWTPLQIAGLSGLLSIGLFPIWITSLSLLLSWTAALALAQGAGSESVWTKQVRIYLCMLLCLMPLSLPHPLTIALNVLAAPVLSVVLFPLSGVVWLLPAFATFIDPVFSVAMIWLRSTAAAIPQMPPAPYIPGRFELWVYLLALNLFWVRRDIQTKRSA